MSISKAEILSQLSQTLNDYLKLQVGLAEKVDSSYVLLWQDIQDYILGGGKRSRAYLLVLSYLAFGGQEMQDILDIALSQEILHTALLIHDDMIDQDFIRHSRPNLAAIRIEQYKLKSSNMAYHLGNSAALLSGDLLLSASYDLILNSCLKSQIKIKLLKILQDDIFLVAGGELMDMETFFNKYDQDQALKIINFKTSMYSFYFPIKMAGILTKTKLNESLLKRFSFNLGQIYQLIDDLNNLFSTEIVIGKPILSDIRDNKKTYIISRVYNDVNEESRRLINNLMGQHNISKTDQKKLQSLIIGSTAYQEILDLIDNLKITSLKLLQELPISNSYLKQFSSYINNLRVGF